MKSVCMCTCVHESTSIPKLHVCACKLGGEGTWSQQRDLQGEYRRDLQELGDVWDMGRALSVPGTESMSKDLAWGPDSCKWLGSQGTAAGPGKGGS